MEQKEFNETLEKLTDKEDVAGIEVLVNSLSEEELELYKTELLEAYANIYSLWYYDLICGKISEKNQEGVVQELFDILTLAEKIDPENTHYRERAQCYEFLSELKGEETDKLLNIQKAIDEYSDALKNSENILFNAPLANALLDKMLITQEFADDEFLKILELFELAFTTYSESVTSSFIHGCFRILNFPFNKNHYWHSRFLNKFNLALTRFTEEEPIIFLIWSDALVRVLEYQQYEISPEYAEELNDISIELLESITDYQTDNERLLNQLGFAFEKAAKRMKKGKLPYYNIALKYFTKGQTLAPATWTFPVYATNVLKAMAVIYHSQQNREKVIELFEEGRPLFSKVYEHEKDFTLNLYWGEYLIEYARLAYNFDAPEILEEATDKSLIAKELGRNYYNQPYTLLAKIALKTGDKDKCMEILKECKKVFSTEYYEYDMGQVLRDEDFREIWAELT
jgi:tetratricopeptide (TPR) repeat protein